MRFMHSGWGFLVCDPVTALMAVGTGVNVIGQISSARSQRRQLESQAGAMEGQAQQVEGAAYLQAAQTREEAQQQARLIQRAARNVRSATTVAYAGSGVRVGEGSAAVVDEAILRDSEQDASMSILTGERRASAIETGGEQDAASLRAGAGNARTAARQSTRAGYLSALSTTLGAAYDYRRWSGRMTRGGSVPGSRAYGPYGDPNAGY